MKEPEWHEVLTRREAVIAGIVGLAVVYPLVYYAYHAGYVFWGYSPPQWKKPWNGCRRTWFRRSVRSGEMGGGAAVDCSIPNGSSIESG
jgi:hypothetical protein